MAPTSILAEQHYRSLLKLLAANTPPEPPRRSSRASRPKLLGLEPPAEAVASEDSTASELPEVPNGSRLPKSSCQKSKRQKRRDRSRHRSHGVGRRTR